MVLCINSAISLNSCSPKPLVVQAGVPNLIPDVIIGLSVSKGIPFLLHVIPAFSSDFSASLPVKPFGLKSINDKCVSAVSYTHLTLPTINWV